MVMGRRPPDKPTALESMIRQRVIVSDKMDNAYEGVLWLADDTGVALMGNGADPVVWRRQDPNTGKILETAVKGQQFVPIQVLLCIQVPG